MHTIEDYAGTESKTWTFAFAYPESCTYPIGEILTITRSREDENTVSLSWKDHEIPGIPFDGTYGRLNGTTSDGFTVTITVVDPAKNKIVGVIQGAGLPEAGTWGADATGGMG